MVVRSSARRYDDLFLLLREREVNVSAREWLGGLPVNLRPNNQEGLSFLLLKEQLHFLHLIVPHSQPDLTIRDGRIGTRSN